MSNLTDVQAVIDAHDERAQAAFQELNSITGSLISAGAGSVIPGSIGLPSRPGDPAGTVSFLSPDLDLYNVFRDEYDYHFNTLQAWITGLRDDFLDLFFPQVTGLIASESDAWIIGVIRDGNIGLPVSAQEAIFERGRERVLKESARVKDGAMNTWATLGYTLPSTVLMDQVAKADQNAADRISELNRDLTIRVLEVQLEMVKFAMQQAIALRLSVVGAVNDYLRTFGLVPNTSSEIAARRVAAKSSLWEAARAYYNSLVDFKRLESQVNIARSQVSAKQADVDIQALDANLQRQLAATTSAAKVYGDLTSAAMSGLNSIVTNAYQANKEE